MSAVILKGTIISLPALGKAEVYSNSYLIAENRRIVGIFDSIPREYRICPVMDYGSDLIVPAFSDMHLHAPQYPMIGTGMDLPLLQWLDTYTFPTEAKFSDPAYARTVYRKLAGELIAGGTTRVCMFSSLHTDSTLILMEELEAAGICGCAGKVNMDQNSPDYLCESTDESQRETIRWLEESRKFHSVTPILTPRFTPSCSDPLMAFLGELAENRRLPIQSHLSENTSEMDWVRELHPDCAQYWETYAKYGLWNNRTLMAHCVWSDPRERHAISNHQVTVAHCPDSNQNLCSGFAPVRTMLREGIRVVLGSDIAGGDHLNMFDVVGAAVRASKARSMMDPDSTPPLTELEALYLGTSAAAHFWNEKPGFAPRNALHALVLHDDPSTLSPTERYCRAVYRRQPDTVQAVWSNGQCVFTSPAAL